MIHPEFDRDFLLGLKDNWDGYGARAPTRHEVCHAYEVYRSLPGTDWHVAAMSSGGIQIERHRDGVDIEITVIDATR